MPLMPLQTQKKHILKHRSQALFKWVDFHSEASNLLLSQNLMTLFWLLWRWVPIIRLKSVSFCSSLSMIIRPRKNQWRLCSLQDRESMKLSLYKLLQIKDFLWCLFSGEHTPVGLSQIKAFYTGRIPFHPLEECSVVVQIPGVKGQPCSYMQK